MKTIIKGGRLIDPARGIDEVTDLLIENGVVAADGADADGAEIIDAGGKWVVPGLIDVHTHLREPGQEEKEDIRSGSRAAVAGGFTAIAAMANTVPPVDNRPLVEFVINRGAAANAARVYAIGSVSKGLKGEELAELADMAEGGAIAFSDDGKPVMNAELMRLALQYTRMFNRPVIAHEEDRNLFSDGVMHFGYWSSMLGLRGIPALAEETMIARDLMLAEATGGHLHVAHVSTARSLALIREAKARGVRVTAEAAVHHLILSDEAVSTSDYDTNTKMNPPLRPQSDVNALREALADGTIDCLVTDHAPHHEDDKNVEFPLAAFGISGLETALPLLLGELVAKNLLTPARLVELYSTNPARVFGLAGGTLAAGAPADITIIDPTALYAVDPRKFYSKGKNTPFAGQVLRGRAVATIVGGQLKMRDGQVLV
ncbi:MAG: dihydroorotase [Chloroflexota bacterium]